MAKHTSLHQYLDLDLNLCVCHSTLFWLLAYFYVLPGTWTQRLFCACVDTRQLKAELREMKTKLEESERLRQIVDEQAEKSRHSYESEISWLKLQLSTFEEDFKSERRAREATATTLEQVRAELAAAQTQVSRHHHHGVTR